MEPRIVIALEKLALALGKVASIKANDDETGWQELYGAAEGLADALSALEPQGRESGDVLQDVASYLEGFCGIPAQSAKLYAQGILKTIADAQPPSPAKADTAGTWETVYGLCLSLGMELVGDASGEKRVVDFITSLAKRPEYQKCPVCGGDGSLIQIGPLNDQRIPCPTCKGSRMIPRPPALDVEALRKLADDHEPKELYRHLRNAVTRADLAFEAKGDAGTKTWLDDYFLPALIEQGLTLSLIQQAGGGKT